MSGGNGRVPEPGSGVGAGGQQRAAEGGQEAWRAGQESCGQRSSEHCLGSSARGGIGWAWPGS